MTEAKRRARLAAIGALTLAGIGVMAALEYGRYSPVEQLGDVRLGASEVDATLAFGRQPDEVTYSVDRSRKLLVFRGAADQSTSLTFALSETSAVLYQVCSTYWTPRGKGIYRGSTESDVLRRLGGPTQVSASPDGTKKISSFARQNLAFEFKRDHILISCVGSDMPLGYRPNAEFPSGQFQTADPATPVSCRDMPYRYPPRDGGRQISGTVYSCIYSDGSRHYSSRLPPGLPLN